MGTQEGHMFLQNFAQLSYIEDELENNRPLSWKILKEDSSVDVFSSGEIYICSVKVQLFSLDRVCVNHQWNARAKSWPSLLVNLSEVNPK